MIVSGRALILAVGRRDFAGNGRPAILLVLPIITACGRPVGVVTFRIRHVLVPLKDGPDCLLAGGVVGGDVQKFFRGSWAFAT